MLHSDRGSLSFLQREQLPHRFHGLRSPGRAPRRDSRMVPLPGAGKQRGEWERQQKNSERLVSSICRRIFSFLRKRIRGVGDVAGRFAVPHHAAKSLCTPVRRYRHMIPNLRKRLKTLLIVPLLLALLAMAPLLGGRTTSTASHGGVIAMKCVCGSAARAVVDSR